MRVLYISEGRRHGSGQPTASVEALADGIFKVISIINTIKEGGKQRLRLLTELNSLWMVFKLVESNFGSEEEDLGEAWLKMICILNEDHVIFDQIGETVDNLTIRLQPKVGLRMVVQTIRWPFDKSEVEASVTQLERLKSAVNLALTSTSAAVIRDIQNDTKALTNAASDKELKAILNWTSTLNFLKQQNDFIRQTRQGTGSWFLEKETFNDWLTEGKAMLWCPGMKFTSLAILGEQVLIPVSRFSGGG